MGISSLNLATTVNSNSVNSVYCSATPEENPNLMMAGTDVTIINGGGLQVSHTSVMPEIKGIQGLVYMIFANDRRLRKLESDRATSSISGYFF